MSEYAPAAIRTLADRIIANVSSARMSGIVGDSQHGFGYHRSRNALRARGEGGDYSIQLAEDKAGDGDAASALDISYDAFHMQQITTRLLQSAKDENDPRLNVCREFYGTLDGKKVTGWDTHFGRPETSDDSHLWHVHISFLRKYATDDDAMDQVLSVVLGEPYEGDDDVSAKDVWTYDPGNPDDGGVANLVGLPDSDTNRTVQPAWALNRAWAESRDSAATARAIAAEQAAAKKREEALAAQVQTLSTRLDAATTQLGNILAAVTALAGAPAAVVRAATADALDAGAQALRNKA